MNTWANYNENGADASQIGGGWMTLDEAEEFLNNHANEEVFINDTENCPFDYIDEYSDVELAINDLREYDKLDSYEREVVSAILEAGSVQDFDEALQIESRGDYVYYSGVTTNTELAYAEIESVGSLKDALGDKLTNYIDEDAMRDDYEDDIRRMIAEDEYNGDIDMVTDEELDDTLDSVIQEDIWLAEQGDIDLSNYFDYSKYGEMLWGGLNLDSYTQEALEDYRQELGLPPLDDNRTPKSRKELELSYGFIGDDIEDEEEVSDIEIRDPEELERAQEEYDNFVDEYSFEIRLAELGDYDDIAEEYISSCYGDIDRFAREESSDIRDYVNIESFARDLFYDYTFVDGYVFNNYNNSF